jgi:hypothetical protein
MTRPIRVNPIRWSVRLDEQNMAKLRKLAYDETVPLNEMFNRVIERYEPITPVRTPPR